LNVHGNPTSPDTLHFNDHNCNYYSRSYYCQPVKNAKNYGGFHRRRRAPVVKKKKPVMKKACFVENQFYFGQGRTVPSFAGKTPTRTRQVSTVWYRNTGGTWPGFSRGNDFAVRWTSTMKVNTAGTYRFFASSDDGSKVVIDGRTVVNNDGLHGLRRKEGSAKLSRGNRLIKIYFFEKGGHAGMYFGMKGPDTKNQWTRGTSYGGLTCPKKKAAAAKPPLGVLQNYDQTQLVRAGWKVWSDVPYSHHTVRSNVIPSRGDCLLWGSKKAHGSTAFQLAAIGRRSVINSLGKYKNRHDRANQKWENGVYWYLVTDAGGSGSCGFSADENLNLNSADVYTNTNSALRLSWHLHTNMKVGGYRSGKTMGLNRDGTWRKVVMYGPCSGVKEGKKR